MSEEKEGRAGGDAESPAGKDLGKPSRKRREPRPPLQSTEPMEEGAPVPPPARPEGVPNLMHRLKVADIMTSDPLCCLPDTPLGTVARLMAENSCGAIPVIAARGDRRPVGMITDRDVTIRSVAEGRNPLDMAARDVMTPSVVTVSPEAPAEDGADLMRRHKLRRILVVDGAGAVIGLLVQAQIALHLPHDRSGGTVRDISRPAP